MGFIQDLYPLNLREEKVKFFLDFSYNPQFTYNRSFNLEELSKWGQPSEELAQKSLTFTKAHPFFPPAKQEPVSLTYINTWLHNFSESLPAKSGFHFSFSSKIHARCLVGTNTLTLKVPVAYSQDEFHGLMRHELETHFLRRYNHLQQTWGDTYFDEIEMRRTEEGLATLHTYLFKKNKVMHKPFINYIAVYLASHYSFADVFQSLRGLGLSLEKAWNTTVRVKRGLTNTQQPGGLTKDICYLEGVIMVWHWLLTNQESLSDLYSGRIPLSAVAKLRHQINHDRMLLPTFFKDEVAYFTAIKEIGTINNLAGLLSL